jgi:hypothetical protein
MILPDLNTLPQDIYNLFDPDVDHKSSEEYLDIFTNNLKDILRSRLAKQSDGSDRPIRFSALGRPNLQVWYDAHPIPGGKEKLLPKTYVKFLYGDIIEQLLLYLAREAGHEVQDCQKQVEIDGVTGSIDAIIDGVVVDVKSASPFGYRKFEEGTVTQDDPFGYVAQLSGYANVLTPGEGAAWLANDKVAGDICISPLAPVVIKHHPPAERIAELKEVINNETPPDRCYDDVPDGKSGNRKLSTGCSYCRHKFRCWDGLRGFAYSNGPRFLTHVERVPDVPEITQ